jgi:hypothetical protein
MVGDLRQGGSKGLPLPLGTVVSAAQWYEG